MRYRDALWHELLLPCVQLVHHTPHGKRHNILAAGTVQKHKSGWAGCARGGALESALRIRCIPVFVSLHVGFSEGIQLLLDSL